MPSLAQLDQAVREFMVENPNGVVTVVVDASFGHRIDPSEVNMYEEADSAGELVSPPAGAIGRGDAFLLRIADKMGATVLSNDSFQEFHGEHTWLFDKGRLIGGKPVPGVGWIFTPRTPVRGHKSREAVKEAKLGDETKPASAITGLDMAAERTRGRGKEKKTVERAIALATEEAVEPQTSKRRRHRAKGGVPPADPVNEPLTFIKFIAAHPLGTEVDGTVDSFASHGAFVEVEGARCYLPLSAMGDPPPRSGREVFARGDARRFVVQALDPQRRGVELALPGFARIAGTPTDETVEAEIAGQVPEPIARNGRRRGRRSRSGATADEAALAGTQEAAAAAVEWPMAGAEATAAGQEPMVGVAPAAGPAPAAGGEPMAGVAPADVAPAEQAGVVPAPVPAMAMAPSPAPAMRSPKGQPAAPKQLLDVPSEEPAAAKVAPRRRRKSGRAARLIDAESVEGPIPFEPGPRPGGDRETAGTTMAPDVPVTAKAKPSRSRAGVSPEASTAQAEPLRKASAGPAEAEPARKAATRARKPAARKIAATGEPAPSDAAATGPAKVGAKAKKDAKSPATTARAPGEAVGKAPPGAVPTRTKKKAAPVCSPAKATGAPAPASSGRAPAPAKAKAKATKAPAEAPRAPADAAPAQRGEAQAASPTMVSTPAKPRGARAKAAPPTAASTPAKPAGARAKAAPATVASASSEAADAPSKAGKAPAKAGKASVRGGKALPVEHLAETPNPQPAQMGKDLPEAGKAPAQAPETPTQARKAGAKAGKSPATAPPTSPPPATSAPPAQTAARKPTAKSPKPTAKAPKAAAKAPKAAAKAPKAAAKAPQAAAKAPPAPALGPHSAQDPAPVLARKARAKARKADATTDPPPAAAAQALHTDPVRVAAAEDADSRRTRAVRSRRVAVTRQEPSSED